MRQRKGAPYTLLATICAVGFVGGFLWATSGPPRAGGAAAGLRLAPHAALSAAASSGVAGGPAYQAAAQANLTAWRSALFERAMGMLREAARAAKPHAQVQPAKHRRFDLFSPFLSCPEGEALARIGGDGDGGKLMCPSLLQSEGCVIYSLGSNNQFEFEEELLKTTKCKVVSFDCTSPGRTLDPRHTFVPKCLGSEERMRANSSGWITLGEAMREYGHAEISLLKIDIEGFEYDVLSKWRNDGMLPRQVSMELHYTYLYWGGPAHRNPNDFSNMVWPMHELSLAELALFVAHLADLGYGIVSREDNPLCATCSELTLLRVGVPTYAS